MMAEASAHAPAPWRQRAYAWLGLLSLWLLFELPMVIRSDIIEPAALRPSPDILALLTLWSLSLLTPSGRALRWVLGAWTTCLVVFRMDQVIFRLLMREEPLLYDQWFMLRHLVVLISDLASLGSLLAVAGFLVAAALLILWTRRVLRRARCLLAPEEHRRTAAIAAGLWAIGLSTAYLLPPPAGSTAPARWLTASLVDNLRSSIATYQSVQAGIARSPYARYAQLALKDKPDLLLFIVESYGRVLATDPTLRDAYAELLTKLEGDLTHAGWSMVSAYSRSSVSGGRSWIAEGTMLMGTPIRYEAVFHHLLSHMPSLPNLVSFLAGQGYETVLLTPADRQRAGLQRENRYGFDRVIDYESLGYRGPAVGWGIVPDKYSLAFAEEHVLANPPRPVFFDYHMVTSHAPWIVPPRDAEGGTQALRAPEPLLDKNLGPKSPHTLALRKLKYYAREPDGRYPFMPGLSAAKRYDYQETIHYDLALIADYLRERERDGLVILLGDHQPPVITEPDASFDTPVHVLSRDARHLEELRKLGFVAGLRIPQTAPAPLTHAGFFSAVVRTLASTSGASQELPPVLREGRSLLP